MIPTNEDYHSWHLNHGLLLMRTRPGSITVNAFCSCELNRATASITLGALARRMLLWNLTKITPADECPRA
jgi:hypothetical protein